jgi:hypothetical protein
MLKAETAGIIGIAHQAKQVGPGACGVARGARAGLKLAGGAIIHIARPRKIAATKLLPGAME